MTTRPADRAAGALLLIEALLLFVPVIVLGSAIGWPASLSEPPSVVLPLIQEQAGAVRIGYLVYLAYSILIWPMALLTIHAVARGEAPSPLLRVAAGFAVASAVARALGIIRWLVAMPALAAAYTDPAAGEGTRAAVEVTYGALNNYGGSVGEVLGVTLFAALWLACTSAAALRSGALPRWLGVAGLAAAAALSVGLVELFGVDLGALITVTASAFQLWLLAAGVTLLARRPAPAPTIARPA